MARQATSVEELAQIARVHSLLSGVMLVPPDVVVTRTNGKKISGQIVRDLVVNKPGKRGGPRVCFGAITLATGHGEVEIDYLDIVLVERASMPHPPSPAIKKRRRRPPASALR